jgi:translation initiation factor eIF-2B subunit epsilon
MTMVLKEASPNHRSQAKGEQFCLVLDADNAQCLHYEPLEPVASKKKVKVELDLLKGHEALQFRNDLIDCCVDICSIDVKIRRRMP